MSRRHDLRRVLWHLARTAIARFPHGGGGAIAGRVLAPAVPVVAPLTGKPCAAYELLGFPDGAVTWTQLGAGCADELEIADASGRALVRTAGIELALREHWSWFDAPPWYENVVERLLLPGDHVVVCGAGQREPDGSALGGADYRSAAPTRLVLTASPAFPLLLCNEPEVISQPSRTVRLAV